MRNVRDAPPAAASERAILGRVPAQVNELRGGVVLLLLALVVGAGALRLPGIEDRPMHHDEALNSIFVQQLWERGEYEYSPLRFHGPSLTYLTMPFVWASPAETYAATTELTYRVLPALLGVGLVLLTFGLASGLGQGAALAATALCALSPAMVFYSRYYIHEMPLVAFTFLAIVSGWQLLARLSAGLPAWSWALGLGASLGLMHATKETFVIALAAAGLGLAANVRRWRLPPRLVPHLLVAAGAGAFVSVLFFSSFFSHAQGPIDSIATFGAYFAQGTDADSTFARPWSWYFELMLEHEDGGLRLSSEAAIVLLAAVGVFAAARGWGLEAAWLPLARFFAVYTLALTAIYSAISYKTPWCMLSFLHGMIVLAGIGTIALLRSAPRGLGRAVVVVGLLAAVAHLAYQSYLVNFRHGADPRNPHVFAHALPGVRDVSSAVKRLAQLPDEGRRPRIHVFNWGGGNGPLYFYMRGVDGVRYRSAEETAQALPALSVVLVDEARRDQLDDRFDTGYHVERYELRPGIFGLLYVRQSLWDALPAASARGGRPQADEGPPRPSFLLISVDTLRRDHLGSYGYPRATSPQIDALAARGTVFTNAVSTSSWTLPAHASLLTGRYPSYHGLEDDGLKLRQDVPTLAASLQAAGYHTLAVVSHVYVSRAFGLERGFDVFDDSLIEEGLSNPVAEAVVDRFLEHAGEGLAEPFFAFVHFFDPHWPYEPPEPFRSRFALAGYAGPVDGSVRSLLPWWADEPMPAEDRDQMLALYDGEIAYLDGQIGRLLDALEDPARRGETVVLITADHGEEFKDHGRLGHGRTLFEEQLRVPLVAAGHPLFAPGTRRDDLVSITDLAPTILDLAGAGALAGANGRSVRAAGPPERAVFAESIRFGVEMRSVHRGRYKGIEVPSQGERTLFDLAADPAERSPLEEDPTRGGVAAELARYAERADSGWHVKIVAPGDARVRARGRIRTTGRLVAPRHYASQNVRGRAAVVNTFRVRGPNENELLLDVVLGNHLAEVVFETEPRDAEVTFELAVEDLAGAAGVFVGSGAELEGAPAFTLQRNDPRLASSLADYDAARPGVYIRAVSDASAESPASNLSEGAVERLRALGYLDAGPDEPQARLPEAR